MLPPCVLSRQLPVLVHEKLHHAVHALVKDEVLALPQKLLHEHLGEGDVPLAVGEVLGRRDLRQGVDALQHLHGPGVVSVAHQEPQGLFCGLHHVQLPHLQKGAPQGRHAVVGGDADLIAQFDGAAHHIAPTTFFHFHKSIPP